MSDGRLLSSNQRDSTPVPAAPHPRPLSVISTSLPVINKMSKSRASTLSLRAAPTIRYDVFLGMRTGDAIRPLRAKLVSMSSTAVTMDSATTSPRNRRRETSDDGIRRPNRSAADHTKFRKSGVYQLAALDDFYLSSSTTTPRRSKSPHYAPKASTSTSSSAKRIKIIDMVNKATA